MIPLPNCVEVLFRLTTTGFMYMGRQVFTPTLPSVPIGIVSADPNAGHLQVPGFDNELVSAGEVPWKPQKYGFTLSPTINS